MPIRREVRWLYPIDWRELSIAIRFKRGTGMLRALRPAARQDGRASRRREMVGEERQAWRCDKGRAVRRLPAPVADGVPQKTTRVLPATAHLNHDPSDSRPANLRALCQRCHILHDKEEHRIRRRLTYRARKALGDLFTGAYPS